MPDVSASRPSLPNPAGGGVLRTEIASARTQRVTRHDGRSEDVRETVMRVGVGRIDARVKVRVPLGAEPVGFDALQDHVHGPRHAGLQPEVRVSNLRVDGEPMGAWLQRESMAWAESDPSMAIPVLAVTGAAVIAGAVAYGKRHGGIRVGTGSHEIVSFEGVSLQASAGIRVAGQRAVDWDHAALRARSSAFGDDSQMALGAVVPRHGRPRLEASWDKALGREGAVGFFGTVDTHGDVAVGIQMNVSF